jgi:hypothetical protein
MLQRGQEFMAQKRHRGAGDPVPGGRIDRFNRGV